MKNFNFSLTLVVISLIVSCKAIPNYQVFNTTSTDLDNSYSFQNQDIAIKYILWCNGGKIKVEVKNISNQPIIVDWTQSSLIINGISFSLFQDEEYTQSKTVGKTVTGLSWSGLLVSPSKAETNTIKTKPSKTVFIPPNSAIQETFYFGQISNPIVDCDLIKLKFKEKEKTLTYTKETTPYNYRFYMGYSNSKTPENISFIDNNFWVEKVTLMRQKEFQGKTQKVGGCDKIKLPIMVYEYPYKSQKSFYWEVSSK